ncbi:hypothetical protein EMCRGX_G011536 [Ephydatia muelleri]
MRMQTGFEMKTLARTAEKGANNLLHSISLNSSFVAALEEQLNNLLDFTRRHVAEVRTRLKLGVVTKEELYHLGDVLLSLQSTLIRGLQDLRDLADVFDNLNGNSNAASDFLQSLDVLEKKNRVEDDITSELATLYSLLKDTSTKSKLLRRGTISGETRKQKHGYHVIGSPILLVAMWLVLLLTTCTANPYQYWLKDDKRKTLREGESIKRYAAELQKLTEHCNFGPALNEALRDRLICGMRNQTVQKRLLVKADLNFAKALGIAEMEEMAIKDASELQLQAKPEPVHHIEKPQGLQMECAQKTSHRHEQT